MKESPSQALSTGYHNLMIIMKYMIIKPAKPWILGKFSKASEDDPDLGKNGGDYWRQAVLSLIDRKTTRRQRTIWQCQFSIYECRKEDAKSKLWKSMPMIWKELEDKLAMSIKK